MLLISHRGNLIGSNPAEENTEQYIKAALGNGFDVEIDIWSDANSDIYLGHDEPAHKTDIKFLSEYKKKLWIHCKNLAALNLMSNQKEFNYFWHQTDDYVLTSKGYIWTYPGKTVGEKNILVVWEKINKKDLPKCFGICTDYPILYQ